MTSTGPDLSFGTKVLSAPAVVMVGDEPVLVFDDAIDHADALVAFAEEQARFEEAGTASGGYPGIASGAPVDYAKAIARAADPFVREVWRLGDAKLSHATCRLSIVTRDPATLAPLQRVPHIDTTDPMQFAFLHYLSDIGGTGFYRHRATGLSIVSPDEADRYDAARDAALAADMPGAAYIDDNSATFKRIGRVEARFNRLVVYRSCMLHSGIVPVEASLSPDPRTGRLTANIFVAYRHR